jgi:hypothetical protein
MNSSEAVAAERPDTEEPSGPTCPVCGGPMIPTRSVLRCLRCCFVICEACESEAAGSG